MRIRYTLLPLVIFQRNATTAEAPVSRKFVNFIPIKLPNPWMDAVILLFQASASTSAMQLLLRPPFVYLDTETNFYSNYRRFCLSPHYIMSLTWRNHISFHPFPRYFTFNLNHNALFRCFGWAERETARELHTKAPKILSRKSIWFTRMSPVAEISRVKEKSRPRIISCDSK